MVKIKVDHRAYETIRVLFGDIADEKMPGSIKWVDFLHAMARIGFSAMKLGGSAWRFIPSDVLGLHRGIHFHEPHPESKIPILTALCHGRRLGRIYDWTMDTFQEM